MYQQIELFDEKEIKSNKSKPVIIASPVESKENPTDFLKEIIEHQADAVCDIRNWESDGPTDVAILDRYAKTGTDQNDYPNVSGSRLFGYILPELKKMNVPAEAVLSAFQKALLTIKKHIQYDEKCMQTSLSCYYGDDSKSLWIYHFKDEYRTYLATCKFAGCRPRPLKRVHLAAIDNAIAVLKDKPKWILSSSYPSGTPKQKQSAETKKQKEIADINANRERIEKIRENLSHRIAGNKIN